MNEAELNALVKEMRDDYQIPPYHPDSELKNYAKEGEMHLGKLNSGCSITEDLLYRSLLKTICIMLSITRPVSFLKIMEAL